MQRRYAGFWLRTVAAIIDAIILIIITNIIGYFLIEPIEMPPPPKTEDFDALITYIQQTMKAAAPIQQAIISAVLTWGYFAFQESSSSQATLGKLALGIRVSTLDGARLNLLVASLRAWPIYLPSVASIIGLGITTIVMIAALIACVSVAFSARKQGIHDKMAGAVLTRI